MKNRYRVSLFGIIILCALAWSGTVQAAGLGLYAQGGGGSAEWEADDLGGFYDFDSDSVHWGVGILFDTNVAKDSLFHYRASFGYERAVHDPDNHFGDIEFDSYVFDQDFGFGLYRSSKIRFWVGPELRLTYMSGEPDNADNLEFKLFGVGVGPVAGVNFHISPNVSLGLKGGILAIGYAGEVDDDTGFADDEDYEVSEGYAFVNVAIIFRFNDRYEGMRVPKTTTF